MRQVDIYTPMKAMLSKAWVLWELTMLAEPLMVVAPTPGPPPSHHTIVLTHRTHPPVVLTHPRYSAAFHCCRWKSTHYLLIAPGAMNQSYGEYHKRGV